MKVQYLLLLLTGHESSYLFIRIYELLANIYNSKKEMKYQSLTLCEEYASVVREKSTTPE